MASKTRVVVTSKLEHLKRADKILLLHNGDCYFYGTFSELQAQRPDFSSLLLGLEAYDNINAERRTSILTETLRRVSIDETAGFRGPDPIRQSFRQPGGDGYPEKRKQSLILNPLAAARKFSQSMMTEDTVREHPERKFSVVPEDDQVEEVLPRGNLYDHGLQHLNGQRRQSVLAFITNSHSQERREQIQSSFRKKLSITPQYDLASEVDIYARRLSKDSVYDISEDVDEEDMEVELCFLLSMFRLPDNSDYLLIFRLKYPPTNALWDIHVSSQQCFADDRENTFETTSWSTYLRYITTNKSLVYVLIFIVLVFVIEVKSFPCFSHLFVFILTTFK